MHSMLLGARVPRTLDGWTAGIEAMRLMFPEQAEQYGTAWLYRTMQHAEMRACGINALTVSSSNSIDDLKKGFPDQC